MKLLRHGAAQPLLGLAGLALLTFVCFRLDASLPTTAFAFLILMVLLSLMGGSFVALGALSIIAVACLSYFFSAPIFDLRMDYPLDAVLVSAFLISSLVVNGLIRRSRRLQHELRLAIDTIPAVVWSKLPDGSADFLNRRFRDYTGLSVHQGRGWGWMDAFHPEDRAVDAWRAALAAGEPFEKEVRLRRADGEYRWFVLRAVPLRDGRGNIVRWYGTTSDIEDRKRAEAVLREQARLLDLSHDTIFVRDMNDVITYWNRGAEELYGWTGEQAVGKTTHQLLQTDFPEPLEQIKEKLLQASRWEGELVHTKRDGTRVTVASRWALQRDARGHAIAVLETNNDVTERKRSEAELLHKNVLLDELFEGGPDAVVLLDPQGRVLRTSREFATVFGYAAEEAAGRSIYDLIVPEGELESARALHALVLSRGERVAAERERRRKDGTRIHVSVKGAPVVLGGKPIGLYAIYRDMTERKRNEEALRLSEERYARAMEGSDAGHWEWDLLTDEMFVSERAREMLALPAGTLAAHRAEIMALVPQHPDDLALMPENIRAGIESGSHERDYRVIPRPGEVRWLHSRGKVFRDERGNPVRLTGSLTDITERKRTEEALLRSDAYLTEAQRLSRAGSWAWNVQTRQLTHCSEELYRTLGFDPRDGLPSDQAILDRIHPSDQARYVEDLRSAMREKRNFETHFRLCLPDFTLKHVLGVGHPVLDASGVLAEYVGTLMDVTEGKRAEEAVRQSEERWKAVFEHNPTMYFMVDAAGTIISVNAFGAEHLGYAVDELVGQPVQQVFPETSRDALQGNLVACLEHLGRTIRWELPKRRKDGTLLWARETAKAVLIRKRPLVLIVCEDITDSKQAREDLRESEARYRNIFQSVGVSIWEEDFSRLKAAIDELKERGVGDFRGYLAASPEFVQQAISMVRVVDVNDVTLKLFEATTKDELLASLHKVFVPETREVFVEELVALAEGRRFFEAETVLQTLKGARLNALFTITFPQPNAHARYDGVLVTITDVTEQRAREREREELGRQLQQAARMEAIGRLAGGIAHDFNNILGAILGYGELAQQHLSEAGGARRHVDQVMHAGARGKGLVERILAFSRSGLGERAPVHVQAVVEETLELLTASLPSGVRLERTLDSGDAAVVGDATQLHQVAMNLCTNGVQAIERGGVLTVALDRAVLCERRIVSHGTLYPGDYVRLSVSDTGAGIPAPVLERMFDPFFTTKRVGDGTGLGLALVHGIVADFGGAIDVATRSGAGSSFTVWLPAAGETPRPLTEAARELPHGNGETVMIVDDERALVAVAEETLAALGYEPAGFESSLEALAAFRAEPGRFDLVLTDETMPDLSGVELAHEIRGLRPGLPIVLMSGYSGAQLCERAYAAGVAEVLRKPLVRRDIAEALGRALRPAQQIDAFPP